MSSLSDKLTDACETSVLSNNLKFLPQDTFDELICCSNITAELPNTTWFQSTFSNWFTLKSPYIHQFVFKEARKLFTILVLMERVNIIPELLKQKITDDDLPFEAKKKEESIILQSLSNPSRIIPGISGSSVAERFVEMQWRVLVPIINTCGQHLVLHKRCILPIMEDKKETIYSGRSPVFKGKLHRAHFRPSSIRVSIH